MTTLKFKNSKKNKKNMKKELIVISLLIILIVPTLSAADYNHIISNSEKWTDVYSTLLLGKLLGVEAEFLVSTRHGPLLLNGINRDRNILVASSDDRPYVFNYPSTIRDTGFEGAEEISSDNLNIELLEELEDVNSFIVVSDAFGYNSLAVAPYAKITNSWVLFANENNIFEVDSVLSQRNVNELLIYGFVDPIVTETLSKYNPEIIDNGDRFEDNIEIVEKFLDLKPTTQTILTNGEFIEKEILSGTDPVLFTGKENVPPQINEYLKESPLEIGVLIGNDLVGAAQNIKQSSGLYVMVKFARSARSRTDGVAAVEGLDLFPVPTPNMLLELHSIKYNQANGQLEVTYKSSSNIPIYFKGTLTIISGGESKRVGDIDAVFIAPGDFKTVIYPLDLNDLEDIQAEIYTLYGETPGSLEKVLVGTVEVSSINVIDTCKLERDDIKSVKYSRQKEAILVKITNPHDIDCWVDVEIENLQIGSSKKTIGTDGATRLTPKKTRKISLEQELTEADLERNKKVEMTVRSGEREDSLVHSIKDKFDLTLESLALLTYAIIALIVIIIALVIAIIIIKRRKDNEYY